MQTQTDIRSITNTIIEALTNGSLPPWRKPWSNAPNAPGLPTSMSTGIVTRSDILSGYRRRIDEMRSDPLIIIAPAAATSIPSRKNSAIA